ncbi:MAG: hypothetical protein SPI65_03160 [Peptoniphilus sp.]|nr:hypothetical protein [Peptoniphilus sp.]MDD7362745.1 hypothetical protein [Bacillota bacterium]MDY6044561.1 hypothetical protein [Peptoniphilus sp.]
MQARNDEEKSDATFKKDYQGVPIEVQRAIGESKHPPEASKRSTAFGRSAKKDALRYRAEDTSAARGKKPRGLHDDRIRANREMKEKRDREKRNEAQQRVPKRIRESAETGRRKNPLDVVDAYDAMYRPFIYQEIVGKPKSRRK